MINPCEVVSLESSLEDYWYTVGTGSEDILFDEVVQVPNCAYTVAYSSRRVNASGKELSPLDFVSYDSRTRTYEIETAVNGDAGFYFMQLVARLDDAPGTVLFHDWLLTVEEGDSSSYVDENHAPILEEDDLPPSVIEVIVGEKWSILLPEPFDEDEDVVIIKVNAGRASKFLDHDNYRSISIDEGATTVEDIGTYIVQVVLRDQVELFPKYTAYEFTINVVAELTPEIEEPVGSFEDWDSEDTDDADAPIPTIATISNSGLM